jgi:hypothetical protein
VSWFTLTFLLALVGTSADAIGRMHMRFAYRAGYRQGHTDGAHRQFGTVVRALEEVSRNGSAVFARQPVTSRPEGQRAQRPLNVARHRRED